MYAENSDALYVLTMHPQIIGRTHRLALLERLIQHMRQFDDIWFTHMHQVADRFRSLPSSAA